MSSFLRGLGFGAGFSISVIAIFFVFTKFYTEDDIGSFSQSYEEDAKFRELSFDEQISEATALVIARYSDTEDGGRIAIISEIHKDNESIFLNVKIGDVRQDSKYYPDENEFRTRTATITIYTGSPPEERSTLYLYGDRIAGYGNMPLKLLLEKFGKSETQ